MLMAIPLRTLVLCANDEMAFDLARDRCCPVCGSDAFIPLDRCLAADPSCPWTGAGGELRTRGHKPPVLQAVIPLNGTPSGKSYDGKS